MHKYPLACWQNCGRVQGQPAELPESSQLPLLSLKPMKWQQLKQLTRRKEIMHYNKNLKDFIQHKMIQKKLSNFEKLCILFSRVLRKCIPRWFSPKPKGSQRAYVSFNSCSFFSMMVWTMVEVTSPLQVPTAIIPHASAVTPTTWGFKTHRNDTNRILLKNRELYRKCEAIPPCWI